ncbi:MAG: hypothetical protein FWF92_00425 [Oscillospiraceae bacterium]|nr:hypothetical protein [Oscillospiraceae bacterium]
MNKKNDLEPNKTKKVRVRNYIIFYIVVLCYCMISTLPLLKLQTQVISNPDKYIFYVILEISILLIVFPELILPLLLKIKIIREFFYDDMKGDKFYLMIPYIVKCFCFAVYMYLVISNAIKDVDLIKSEAEGILLGFSCLIAIDRFISNFKTLIKIFKEYIDKSKKEFTKIFNELLEKENDNYYEYGHCLTKNPYLFIPDLEYNAEYELLNWRHALLLFEKQSIFKCTEHSILKDGDTFPNKQEISDSINVLDDKKNDIQEHDIPWGMGISAFSDKMNLWAEFPENKWILELAKSDISDDEFLIEVKCIGKIDSK